MDTQRTNKHSLTTPKIVLTNGVRQCKFCLDLLTDLHDPYITMAVVTGLAGIGKSVAFQYYYETFVQLTKSTLPTLIKVEVVPRSSPRALARDIMISLQERPKTRGGTVYEFAEEAAEAIVRNDLRLIMVDEADRLNEESFELLRHLFDKTGCPIVLVGLPTILRVIDRHEKFTSRVGLRLSFPALEFDEFLTDVLPALDVSRWVFDPQQETDQLLAQELWTRVHPSFRKLKNVLTLAGKMTGNEGKEIITLPTIKEAFQYIASAQDHKLLQKTPEAPVTPLTGSPEDVSVQRQKAKGKNSSDGQ